MLFPSTVLLVPVKKASSTSTLPANSPIHSMALRGGWERGTRDGGGEDSVVSFRAFSLGTMLGG